MAKKRKRVQRGTRLLRDAPEACAVEPAEEPGHERLSLLPQPPPGASPGTLIIEDGPAPRVFVIDYGPDRVHEKELASVDEVVPYLVDDYPSITWIDVRGITNRKSFERIGEIFKIHPLALEDVVNVPQRPHTDEYAEQQVIIARMVQLDEDHVVHTEQLGIVFGDGWVLTVQEEPDRDCLDCVRNRLRSGRGNIRKLGADYLAYAIFDAVIDGFFPVLEVFGERLEVIEGSAVKAERGMSQRIHDVKREMLTIRRAIWPQRDVVNALVRGESKHIGPETRLYLRDTYDHTVQVMDIVETYREIASGLMDLYLSGVSNRMNEVMKVLTVLSTIFMPLTFIAGIYGMNFHPGDAHDPKPLNMPELDWEYGYPFSLALMALCVAGMLYYYRRKGWLTAGGDSG